jgi:hypothetical protein
VVAFAQDEETGRVHQAALLPWKAPRPEGSGRGTPEAHVEGVRDGGARPARPLSTGPPTGPRSPRGWPSPGRSGAVASP